MQRQFNDIMLGSLELFCLAADLGSFSRAATQAGVTPAAVSRAVSRLEERLGVRLFVRTTRHIRLTDAGERYRQQCQNALLLLREAEQEASGEQVSPQGKLRISLPTPYAHYRLLPVLASFQQQFPKIEIDVHISNRNVDFFEEQFDLAIRGAAPKESTLIARKIEDAELVMVASPDYLQRNPAPQHPDDLIHHQCIRYELPSSGRFVPWLYLQEGEIHEYSIHGKINCAGDFLGGLTLARHNAGIFQVYRFAVETELSSGALVEILPAYGGITQPFYLLYPHLRHQSLGLRILISFIMDHLRNLAL